MGEPHNSSADVWALGQLAYQMLICPHETSFTPISSTDENINWPGGVTLDAERLILAMVADDPK